MRYEKQKEIIKPLKYTEIHNILKKYTNVDKYRTKKSYYRNLIISFDIETSSFYEQEEKRAIMYEWSMALEEDVIIGRTYEEFDFCLKAISETLYTNVDDRVIIWVHNLPYEFQFIRKRIKWYKIFAMSKRKVIQAITQEGIEFRCTLILSGYSLNNLTKQIRHYKIKKLTGELDYLKIRTNKTRLLKKEIQYCINDVLIIVYFIAETIERDGDISKIPLTKTGYVRNYCRLNCLRSNDNKFSDKFRKYHKLMKSLTINDKDYKQLKQAFGGGFTHASALYSGKIIKNVHSFDFTSSYPYVMVSERFPMSKPKKIIIKSDEELSTYIDNYCCLFDAEFENIVPTFEYENYISKSHCRQLTKFIENNGRIVTAENLTITLTEQDFKIIENTYDWTGLTIRNFRIFKKEYLPTDYVKSILKLYYDKTTLKGIPEKEEEYLRSKENVNSAYGMMVTDICKDDITYENNEWGVIPNDTNKALEKYNKSYKRFLYYPWGVWVTAYARKNLWTGILEFGEDYIYSDTDSIKTINIEDHNEYIEKYNELVIKKLKKAMEFHNIDIEQTRPKNIKGDKKQIGIWDYEGKYDIFKTLGAKRYITEKNNELHLTVSGVNKIKAANYLKNTYGDDCFNKFSNDLIIPAEKTGKLTHTYLDEEYSGTIVDYKGVKCKYHELSGTHLEPAEYSLSLTDAYIEYLLGFEENNEKS